MGPPAGAVVLEGGVQGESLPASLPLPQPLTAASHLLILNGTRGQRALVMPSRGGSSESPERGCRGRSGITSTGPSGDEGSGPEVAGGRGGPHLLQHPPLCQTSVPLEFHSRPSGFGSDPAGRSGVSGTGDSSHPKVPKSRMLGAGPPVRLCAAPRTVYVSALVLTKGRAAHLYRTGQSWARRAPFPAALVG